jgi:hypothetical protein
VAIKASGAINPALIGTPATPATETGSAWGDIGVGAAHAIISTRRRANDTAASNAGQSTVRGAGSNNSGLKFFEVEVLNASNASIIIGLMNGATGAGAGLDSYVGNIGDSFGLTSGDHYAFVGGTIFTAVNADTFSTFAGDVFGFAVDCANKFAYLSHNGVWTNSGVPTSGATGTGHVATWTGTPTLYPGVTFGSAIISVRLRTVQFLYAPPSGFSAWG